MVRCVGPGAQNSPFALLPTSLMVDPPALDEVHEALCPLTPHPLPSYPPLPAEFTESFISTIGVDFRFRTVKIGDKT